MPSFPILKTGAIAQYPLVRTLRLATQTVEFIDGSRQSYRLRSAATRRWLIRLDQLDPEELNAVMDFAEQQGTALFPFADPVTGDVIARCVIADSELTAGMSSETDGHVVLTIEEIA